MALKNVNIPLNIKDYPTMNDNSGSVYIGVDSLLNSSSSNQNLVTITNYLPSDQSSVNISKMINGIIVGPTTNLSNIQNSIIVGSGNTSSSSLAGSQVSASGILAVGSYLEIPNASNCTILGVGNDPDVQNPLFIIGNGITYSSNHNIVEVTTNSINLTPAGGVSFNMNSSGSTLTGPLTIDAIQGNSITLRGELRVSEIYEDDSADNINFRNNTVFHNEVTFDDNINLQNNTISGGATLNGTYTFDAENGLKIGNKTIQSRGAGTLTLPRGSGTLATTSSLYWVMFNIDWRTHIHDKGIEAAYSVNGNAYSEFTTLYDVAGDVYGLFLSGVSIPAYPSGQYSFKTAVSGSIQTFNSNSSDYPLQSYNLYYAYADADDSPGFLYLIGGAYYGTSEDGYAWHSIKLRINLVSVKFSSDKFDIG